MTITLYASDGPATIQAAADGMAADVALLAALRLFIDRQRVVKQADDGNYRDAVDARAKALVILGQAQDAWRSAFLGWLALGNDSSMTIDQIDDLASRQRGPLFGGHFLWENGLPVSVGEAG